MKTKTYVLTLSKFFPRTHKRAGEETEFELKFVFGGTLDKKHTIRANYPLWKYRIEEVQAGRAVLSVRQWTGSPYRSKQIEIARLTAENGIGIQKLKMIDLFRRWFNSITAWKVERPQAQAQAPAPQQPAYQQPAPQPAYQPAATTNDKDDLPF